MFIRVVWELLMGIELSGCRGVGLWMGDRIRICIIRRRMGWGRIVWGCFIMLFMIVSCSSFVLLWRFGGSGVYANLDV